MTANKNRANKGTAIDILNKFGYENVYASDSGSNVIIVTDTEVHIDNLAKLLLGMKHDTKKKTMFDFYISLSKTNMKTLNKLKEEMEINFY